MNRTLAPLLLSVKCSVCVCVWWVCVCVCMSVMQRKTTKKKYLIRARKETRKLRLPQQDHRIECNQDMPESKREV